MSVSGALVEGAAVPGVSSEVRLLRGSLAVNATVAWYDEKRCGLQFSESVDVQQWLACPTNVEQRRVDEAVRLIKAGAIPLRDAVENRLGRDHLTKQIADDLLRTSLLLETLGNSLASDAATVQQYARELQNLDIAGQTLAALSKAVINGPTDEAMVSKLDHLRKSAAQALGEK